jgi:amino acid transporter
VSGTQSEPTLVRELGVRQLAAGIVNTTVGVGIFILPAIASQQLGAAAPLAFVLCALLMALVVTTFALAGSRVSVTGGLFAYTETAFGPFVGFLAGVLQWLTALLAVSALANVFLDQLAVFTPSLSGSVARLVVLAALLVILAGINIRGVRSGARTIELLTAAKLLPLLLFVGAGVFAVHLRALAWPGLPDAHAISRSVLVLIFAFLGIEVALTPSGEIRDVGRTVPRAIYLALAVSATLYVAIQGVAQGVLGADLAQHAQAPLADAGLVFLGQGGRTLILVGALCSAFGYLSGDMLSSPRNLYGFARSGFLPPIFGRPHRRYRTPHVAIWTHAAIVFGVASSSSFQRLAVISNVGTLTLYLLACAAAVELLRRDVRAGVPPFVVPGMRLLPPLAIAAIVWVLTSASVREFAVTGGTLAVAAVVYWMRRRTARPSDAPPAAAGV